MLLLLVELRSTMRTATLRHSGAFAWKVFVTSRNGRLASMVWTLAKDEVGTYARNSSAVCGFWAHAARSRAAAALRLFFMALPLVVSPARNTTLRPRVTQSSNHTNAPIPAGNAVPRLHREPLRPEVHGGQQS